LIAAAAVTSGGVSGVSGASTAKSTYTIGVVNTDSTPLAVVGEAEQAGMKFAVNQINSAGGIKGHKLVLRLLDDQGTESGASVDFLRLATSYHTQLIIGPGISGPAIAAAPMAKRYGIPDINLVSDIAAAKSNPYVFEIASPETNNAAAMVNYVFRKGIKSAYLIASNGAYGQAGEQGVVVAAKSAGIEITGTNTYDVTAVDFTPQATTIAAANPPAVLIYGSGSSADGQVIKAIRSAGYSGPIIGDLAFSLSNIPTIAGAAATQGLVALAPVNYAAKSGPVHSFLSAYAAKNGSVPSVTTAYGYAAVEMAAAAIKKAGSFRKSAIEKALNSLTYHGVLGFVHYSPKSSHVGPSGNGAFTPLSFSGNKYVSAP
jgi:branched-chain amino acid transport system substrate-binding protein